MTGAAKVASVRAAASTQPLDVFFLMRRTPRMSGLFSLLGLALFLYGCNRPDDRMYPIGPGVKADLVVFFKSDATDDQIYKFVTATISDPKDGGYWPLPGIRTTLSLRAIDGHQGEAITFFPEATEAQRRYARSRIDSSPIVFKVMEDVVPSDIKRVQ